MNIYTNDAYNLTWWALFTNVTVPKSINKQVQHLSKTAWLLAMLLTLTMMFMIEIHNVFFLIRSFQLQKWVEPQVSTQLCIQAPWFKCLGLDCLRLVPFSALSQSKLHPSFCSYDKLSRKCFREPPLAWLCLCSCSSSILCRLQWVCLPRCCFFFFVLCWSGVSPKSDLVSETNPDLWVFWRPLWKINSGPHQNILIYVEVLCTLNQKLQRMLLDFADGLCGWTLLATSW